MALFNQLAELLIIAKAATVDGRNASVSDPHSDYNIGVMRDKVQRATGLDVADESDRAELITILATNPEELRYRYEGIGKTTYSQLCCYLLETA